MMESKKDEPNVSKRKARVTHQDEFTIVKGAVAEAEAMAADLEHKLEELMCEVDANLQLLDEAAQLGKRGSSGEKGATQFCEMTELKPSQKEYEHVKAKFMNATAKLDAMQGEIEAMRRMLDRTWAMHDKYESKNANE
jgi:peptidoglycan hydrolase CwlO-like protein